MIYLITCSKCGYKTVNADRTESIRIRLLHDTTHHGGIASATVGTTSVKEQVEKRIRAKTLVPQGNQYNPANNPY